MRRKFPFFWILQVFIFATAGMMSMVCPEFLLQIQRGEHAPVAVDQPKDALYDWVLGLQEIAPAPDSARTWLLEAGAAPNEAVDQSVVSASSSAETGAGRGSVSTPLFARWAESPGWESVEHWILSATPAPPGHSADAIHAWIHAIDEFERPSPELTEWIGSQVAPESPPRELRRIILDARQTRPIVWDIASDQIRLAGPCMLAVALFTLFGLVSPSIRRPLARIFVLVTAFTTIAMLRSSLGVSEWNLTHGLLAGGLILGLGLCFSMLRAIPGQTTAWTLWAMISAWWLAVAVMSFDARHEVGSHVGQVSMMLGALMLAMLGIVNAWYWLIGKNEDPSQDDAGIAQNRPPQLWTLWVIQFIVFMSVGAGTLLCPEQAAELFTNQQHDYLTNDIVNDSTRQLGGWVIAMALFSFFALGVGRDWHWQGIGVIFMLVFGGFAITSFVNGLSGEYSLWEFAYGCQGLVFIPATYRLLKNDEGSSTENVEDLREDLSVYEMLVSLPLMRFPFDGRRPLYEKGVAACGHLTIYSATENSRTPDFPPNQFFSPGRKFRVETRFSNCLRHDDAALDVRGCAMRLRAVGADDTFDLLMATGSFAPIRCLKDVKNLSRRSLTKRIASDPVLRNGLAAGMRRAPDSYTCLTYYNQIVLEWLLPGSDHRLVRLRLIPANSTTGGEGFPELTELQCFTRTERSSAETRDTDYLQHELHQKLARGEEHEFQLQAQFHDPDPDDSLDWYDATLEWDERDHPWISLGSLVLDTPMDAESCDSLRINPSNIPSAIRVPNPERITDYADPRSLAVAQFRIASLLGWIRTWRRRPVTKR